MPALQEYLHCYRVNGSVTALGEPMWLGLSRFHDQPVFYAGAGIVKLAAALMLFCLAILICYLPPTLLRLHLFLQVAAM